MTKKKEKTANIKVEPEEHSNYSTPPIYISLNGNGWKENCAYLTTAIYQAHENGSPLYVTTMVGGPGKPPECPPGFPNC